MSLRNRPFATQAARQALQGLAIEGLSAALARTGDAQVVAEAGLSDLLYSLQDAGDLTHAECAAAKTLKEAFLITAPPVATLAWSRWAGVHFSGNRFIAVIASVRDRITRFRGPNLIDGDPLAPMLLNVIAREAFTAPNFRRVLALEMRTHLRSRVILHPDGGAVPVFAIPSLLTLAVLGVSRCQTGLPRTSLFLLADRLADHVARTRMEDGWAGFWDVYLDHAARQAGLDMPEPTLEINLSPNFESQAQIHPRWQETAPGYAERLFQGAL